MKIWDRKNNEYIEEPEAGKTKLNFLYNTVAGRILLKTIFASRWFSNIVATYQRSKISKSKIYEFVNKYNIDMSKYNTVESYSSFSDFFTRKREIVNYSKSNELVSIADAKLKVVELNNSSVLNIKGSAYELKDILKDKELAHEYEEGICLIYRLTLNNYHRYNFLDDGKVVYSRKIKGKLHTVQPISKKYKVYCTNTREYQILETQNFGRVTQIEVGAMLVGKINNNNKQEFTKLEEKGYFDYGGSTIIQIFKKDEVYIEEDIVQKSKNDEECSVIIGEIIGRSNKK